MSLTRIVPTSHRPPIAAARKSRIASYAACRCSGVKLGKSAAPQASRCAARQFEKPAFQNDYFPRFPHANEDGAKIVAPLVTLARSASGIYRRHYVDRAENGTPRGHECSRDACVACCAKKATQASRLQWQGSKANPRNRAQHGATGRNILHYPRSARSKPSSPTIARPMRRVEIEAVPG